MKKISIAASMFYVCAIMPVNNILNVRLQRREFRKVINEQTGQKIALFYARLAELEKTAAQRIETKRNRSTLITCSAIVDAYYNKKSEW